MQGSNASRAVDTVCPYCGVGCGMTLQVEQGKVIKVAGIKTHPTNFGRLCTKGSTSSQALRESGRMEAAFMRSDRLREPVRVEMDAAIKQTARRMAKDVDQALRDVVARHGGLDAEQAQAYVRNLISDKRYVRDVY